MLATVVAALAATASPAFSQVTLLFPYGVAAGDVTPTTAVLWTRPARPQRVAVEVSPDPRFGPLVFSAKATALAATGAVARFVPRGLTPATRYYYRFKVGAGATSETGTFVTAPAAGVSANLRLAFSGDADGTHVGGAPAHSFALLDAVTAERPDVFIFLGDTIYSDSSLASHRANTLDDYRAKYLESRTIAPMRALLRATSVIATWDDHEVENDFDAETVNPVKFAAGHQAFVEAWPITEQPRRRLYRSFRWGKDVEVIVLDLRSYRSRQVSKTSACDNPPRSGVADLAPALPPPLRAALRLSSGRWRCRCPRAA
jgi:alkaline phosphatase D